MSTGSPKTVLHIVDGLGLSGKTRHLVSMVSRLDRRRFTPIVCRLSAEPSPLVAELEAARVPLHTIPCRDGLHPQLVPRLAKLAWSVGAEVVHCYNPRPMLYGGIAARAIGVRAAVGFLSAFACQVPDRAYEFLPQPLTTSSRRNVYRNRIAAASMCALVTVSRSLADRFCQYNGVPAEKMRVIGYGVDVHAIDRVPPLRVAQLRRSLGFGSSELVIGSVGRLVEQKDYPTQLRAFALAASCMPNLRMAIAGDGPLRSQLERMASDLGVADRVRFLGNQDDVPAFLRSVDALIVPGRYETFSLATAEALAAGTPVVAARRGGSGELVTRSGGGATFSPGNAAGLAEAVRALLAMRTVDLAALRARGRSYIAAIYTWPRVMARVRAVHEVVLREQRCSS